MAEGGKRRGLSRSMARGSEIYHQYFCQPCGKDEKHTEASNYCRNCEEYLCKVCSSYHRRFKMLQDHILLDLQQMPNKPPISEDISGRSDPITMATYVKNITVKSNSDSKKNVISGCVVMSHNKLLLADSGNNKVRLVDTDSGRLVSERSLSSRPHQVTRINATEAAITLPIEKKIVLLRIEPEITVGREISVNDKYNGIAFCDNLFIVTFTGNVAIMDTYGRLLNFQQSKRNFSDPDYVTASPDNKSMYVSDSGTYSVVKMSMDGRRLAAYTDEGDRDPGQVTVDSHGMVYVGWRSWPQPACVDQLTADLVKVRTIITGLKCPQRLCFDETTENLYIGEYDVVKVYKLSYI